MKKFQVWVSYDGETTEHVEIEARSLDALYDLLDTYGYDVIDIIY